MNGRIRASRSETSFDGGKFERRLARDLIYNRYVTKIAALYVTLSWKTKRKSLSRRRVNPRTNYRFSFSSLTQRRDLVNDSIVKKQFLSKGVILDARSCQARVFEQVHRLSADVIARNYSSLLSRAPRRTKWMLIRSSPREPPHRRD